MKKVGNIAAMAVVGAILLSSCAAPQVGTDIEFSLDAFQSASGGQDNSDSNTVAQTAGDITFLTLTEEDSFSDKDYETSALYDITEITISDAQIAVDGDGAEVSDKTITITKQGTYRISGTASEVQVVVDADDTDKVQLLLDGVSISNSSTAPIYVKQADKVFITTAAGSENSLVATFTADEDAEEKIDAVIYAKDDVTLNGEGLLSIESAVEHGVVAKDDLVITGGSYIVVCAGKAFDANNSIRIADGDFDITCEKDAFHSEHSEDASLGYIYIVAGDFTIDAQGDAFDSASQLQIEGGSFVVTTAGGSENATESTGDSRTSFMMPSQGRTSSTSTAEDSTSTKAFKAGTALVITDGVFDIDSCDDALHADYSLTISGGTFSIRTGDDAITADTYTTIAGGSFDIITCYEGLEGQIVTLSGGDITMIATDDGINAREGSFEESEVAIYIIDGSIVMDTSSEGDGFDSNGNIYMSGGYVLISSTTVTTDTSLDYNYDGTITGGTFLATGSSGMTTQNFGEDSTQGSIFISMSQTQTGDVTLTDSDGNVIVSYSPAKQYQTITISCAEIQVGETYTLTAGSYTQTIVMDSLLYGEGQESSMSNMFGGNTTQNRR